MADVNAMPTTDDFRRQLAREFKSATEAGRDYIDIRAGNLHKKLGGYPKYSHRMPACCKAMRAEMGNDDKVRNSPCGGEGANLEIRYKIPRPR